MVHIDDSTAARSRGAPYPAISLPRALERAEVLADRAPSGQPISVRDAALSWGLSPKSSAATVTVSALKQYGLASDSGAGPERVIRLTQLLYEIVNNDDRAAKIKIAALTPRVFRERFARWSFTRRTLAEWSDDAVCVHDLQNAYGYNEAAAQIILRAFDETVAFARLDEADHAGVLLELPAGTRHYVMRASPGDLKITPGSGDIGVTVAATGVASLARVPKAFGGSTKMGGQLEDATLAATGVTTKRFTYETDQGTAALELPSRVSRRTATNLTSWFLNLIVQATDRDLDKK